MKEWTGCQSRTFRQLQETVAETERARVISTIHGQHETYPEGAVGSIRLWVYEDGAELRTLEVESRLEKWDFESLEGLRAEFVRQFTEAIAARVEDEHSGIQQESHRVAAHAAPASGTARRGRARG